MHYKRLPILNIAGGEHTHAAVKVSESTVFQNRPDQIKPDQGNEHRGIKLEIREAIERRPFEEFQRVQRGLRELILLSGRFNSDRQLCQQFGRLSRRVITLNRSNLRLVMTRLMIVISFSLSSEPTYLAVPL